MNILFVDLISIHKDIDVVIEFLLEVRARFVFEFLEFGKGAVGLEHGSEMMQGGGFCVGRRRERAIWRMG